MMPSRTPRRLRQALVTLAAGAAGAVALGACGGADAQLPPLAADGRDIMRESGCAACHGRNGAGGVGPGWEGLFGSTRELDTGEQVIADEAYLRRSIVEPDAQKVAGYTVIMPDNNLTDAEVDAVLAYIEALQ
ncbi:MAG: cytochrome c [Actinomycetota bacterium]